MILSSCTAASAKFRPALEEVGRQWNTQIEVNPTQVREEMGHLVKLSVQGDTSGWELHFVDFVFVVLPYSARAAANLAELA